MNRALLVGINAYPGSPLSGCVNDIEDMAGFLTERCGFKMRSVRLLTDARATTAEILFRLKWLVKGARPGDNLFFQFSGHGVQVATRNPDGEVDGLDEAACPVDFDWSDGRMIRDKDFANIFGDVPPGVRFIWVSDSCHSGDLQRALVNSLAPADPRRTKPRAYPVPADMRWRIRTAKAEGIPLRGLQPTAGVGGPALISGCRDYQTSADAWFGQRPNGALTYHLLRTLAVHQAKPLSEIVQYTVAALSADRFDQVPQLAAPESTATFFNP